MSDPLDEATRRLSDGALIVGALRENRAAIDEARRDGAERGDRSDDAHRGVAARLEGVERAVSALTVALQTASAASWEGAVATLPPTYRLGLALGVVALLSGYSLRDVLGILQTMVGFKP